MMWTIRKIETLNRRDERGLILYSWNSLDSLGIRACTAAGMNTALHARGDDSEETILRNRRELSRVLDADPLQWICADQVHSSRSALLTSDDRGRGALSAAEAVEERDALILSEAGLQGMIFTADCLPLILYDTERKTGALIHAGWRGTAGGIVPRTLKRMVNEMNCRRENILAAAGPAIGSCCYQVDLPVYDALTRSYPETESAFTPDGAGHWRLSLEQAVFSQLKSRGVEACEGSGLCSCCLEELSSWRREGQKAGRMATCLCL